MITQTRKAVKCCTVLRLLYVALVQLRAVRRLMLLFYYNSNRSSQTFLNTLVLLAMSSLTFTYNLVAWVYQAPEVNFISAVLDT